MPETQIIVAIIAGVFTLATAFVPYFFNVQIRRTASGSRDLRRLLPGQWVGTAKEVHVEGAAPLATYEVEWNFKVRGRRISATSSLRQVTDSGPSTDSYSLSGYFLHDRFIRLEYFNDNSSEVNFGTEVLHVDDAGRHFVGKFVGYSSDRSAIVSGTIEGTKQ